jgi:hypothetical protein
MERGKFNFCYMHDTAEIISVAFIHNFSLAFSVAEPHKFYAAPDPCKNFDAAPASADPTPAPALLYSKLKFKTIRLDPSDPAWFRLRNTACCTKPAVSMIPWNLHIL